MKVRSTLGTILVILLLLAASDVQKNTAIERRQAVSEVHARIDTDAFPELAFDSSP
jgi:hypothetical protein